MLERFLRFIHDYVSLFGGIGGAVATLVLLKIGKFLSRTRLVLSFDPSSNAYMSTSTHLEGGQQVTRKYLRVSVRAAGVVTMKQGHLNWNFRVPEQYGLDSVRSHPGPLLLRITATAENAAPKSIEIEVSINADLSGFEARLRAR